MKKTSAYIKRFGEPLVIEEREISAPGEGETLIEIKSAGVCGSELHTRQGKDPRIKLPIVPGHEGTGIIADIRGEIRDFFTGEKLRTGDKVIWERGIFCEECRFCKTAGMQYLCSTRGVYGITEDGCYSTHITLKAGTHIVKLPANEDLTRIVSASCSGATAAHVIEKVQVRKGETVLVVGPGPLGIFCTAYAKEAGASRIFVFGTKRSVKRLAAAKEFGADLLLVIDEKSFEERRKIILGETEGEGVDVILECSGNIRAIKESLELVSRGGRIAIAGIGTPVEELSIDFYSEIAKRNVTVAGVWVSDTNHLKKAIEIVQSGKYPFERLVTNTYPLEEINRALSDLENRKTHKSVIIPRGKLRIAGAGA